MNLCYLIEMLLIDRSNDFLLNKQLVDKKFIVC